AAVWVEASNIARATVAASGTTLTLGTGIPSPAWLRSAPSRKTRCWIGNRKAPLPHRGRGGIQPPGGRGFATGILRREHPLPPTPPGVRRFLAYLVDGLGF